MAWLVSRSKINLHGPVAGTSGRSVFFRHSHSQPCRRCLRVRPRTANTGAEAASSISISELVQKRKDIELEIKLAVKREDFTAAARLKEQLEALNREDPVMIAKTALEQAIRDERYEDAARIKTQIKQLETELGPAALEAGLLSTNSTAVTRGIKVQVQSFYLPTKSSPSAGRYMFAYHVTIANESTDTIVQLKDRHWIIMDGRGKTEEVRGAGVVGEQPIILPGKSYEYTSGSALPTPQGSMEGEYSMMVLSQEDGQWADVMEVKIGRFLLDAKGPKAV